jgi:3-oxoacyl-[acyl-carrier-protein] synthase-3
LIIYFAYNNFINADQEVERVNNINSVILGTGAYLPDFVLDNNMFSQTVETSDEWIVSRTGVKERRIEQSKHNYEMIGEACKRALENAEMTPGEIDMIIVSTVTQDYNYPSTGCFVQNYIGADNAASFDISAACAGFVFALDIADAYIKSGRAKNILVASGDMMTRETDYYDRGNCILFGDGAGAAVVSACGHPAGASCRHPSKEGNFAGRGVLATYINCEAEGQKPMFIYSPLYKPGEIFDKETKKFKGNAKKISESYIWQNGREVLQFVSRIVPKALDEALKRAGRDISELRYIILHQANRRILYHVIEKYGLSPDKVPITIDKYGNTSASTVPILLNELNAGGKLARGDLIALVGFGAGLAYGAAVIEW